MAICLCNVLKLHGYTEHDSNHVFITVAVKFRFTAFTFYVSIALNRPEWNYIEEFKFPFEHTTFLSSSLSSPSPHNHQDIIIIVIFVSTAVHVYNGITTVSRLVCFSSLHFHFHFSIVLFHNNFFPSGEQPEHRILAHELQQPTAGSIAIFHKYCCYTKCGSITTNVTLRNHWGMLLMCQNTTM